MLFRALISFHYTCPSQFYFHITLQSPFLLFYLKILGHWDEPNHLFKIWPSALGYRVTLFKNKGFDSSLQLRSTYPYIQSFHCSTAKKQRELQLKFRNFISESNGGEL